MMRGVYGDTERFMETYFVQYPGYYFTGDGCRRDEDGYHWITGRVDDVINVSGHRMGTAEVESALVSHAAVAEAAVVGMPHPIKGQGIYAYVTLNAGVEPSDDLKKELDQARAHGDRPHRHSGRHPVGPRPAEDPLRQDHAPHPQEDRRQRRSATWATPPPWPTRPWSTTWWSTARPSKSSVTLPPSEQQGDTEQDKKGRPPGRPFFMSEGKSRGVGEARRRREASERAKATKRAANMPIESTGLSRRGDALSPKRLAKLWPGTPTQQRIEAEEGSAHLPYSWEPDEPRILRRPHRDHPAHPAPAPPPAALARFCPAPSNVSRLCGSTRCSPLQRRGRERQSQPRALHGRQPAPERRPTPIRPDSHRAYRRRARPPSRKLCSSLAGWTSSQGAYSATLISTRRPSPASAMKPGSRTPPAASMIGHVQTSAPTRPRR